MKIVNKALFYLLFLGMSAAASAQSPSVKSDFFESSGKIYVTVAVIAVIFVGILLMLISLERRLAKIEKEDKDI